MSQSVENDPSDPSEEFWRSHIVASGKFAGSNSQYCRDHGLSDKTFSVYKVKLGFSKPKGRPRGFVEVRPRTQGFEKPAVSLASKKSLPDAKWLAEFMSAFLANQR